MSKWRQDVRVKTTAKVKTLEEFAAFLDTEEGKALLNYDDNTTRHLTHETVVENGNTHVILYNEEFLNRLQDAKVGHVDGTFKSRPKIHHVRQFLTFMVRVYDKVSIY